MYLGSLANIIINTRPLVFLCGPYIDEDDKKDRRNILRKYFNDFTEEIIYNRELIKITPYALVIDKLFDSKKLEEEMNIPLIEEIVAACAFKNYIFIDTMSTVLELGLFSNSYAQNKTTALLPSDYSLFKPSVGYFVTETMNKSQNITLCKYKNRRYNKVIDDGKDVIENLIGFKSNQVPREIENEIKLDFTGDINKYLINMLFTRDINESDKIYFEINSNQLEVLIPAKNLFYLVNKYSNKDTIYTIVLEYFKQNICHNTPEYMKIFYLIKKKKMRMILRSSFEYSFDEVVKNMEYLISTIKRNSIFPQKFKNLEYKEIDRFTNYNRTNFYELMGFNSTQIYRLKKLYQTKAKAITHKKLCINGKSRKIDMYKGTSEGYELRNIHKKIADGLNDIVDLNSKSYAYCNKKSILDCVKNHIDSQYFLKLDICNFFNSISKRSLNKILKMVLSDNGSEMYLSNLTGKTAVYKSSVINEWNEVEKILDLCFVNGKLPLGLVSSPILSNIYMDYFDRRFCDEFPQLKYTRYSDDILISSEEEFDVRAVKQYIIDELKLLKLTINLEKTNCFRILEPGDHIKFLGLNIVRGKKNNYVTVGKKYIKLVSKNVTEYLRGESKFKKSQLVGQIEYLRFISIKDYDAFTKIFKIKTGNEFDYEKFKKIYRLG